MPMSWTPENDRLLLLKLVETHGINVNAEAIVRAWPDGVKPTARAIKERFVKLRQLAGVKAPGKVSVTSVTPRKAGVTQPKTPTSSAKKRKVQEVDTESDGDGHLTEEDTPATKGKLADNGRAMFGNSTHNLNANIKQEPGFNLATNLDNPFDFDGYGNSMHGQSFANLGVGTSGMQPLDNFYQGFNTADSMTTPFNMGSMGTMAPNFEDFDMGFHVQNPIEMPNVAFPPFDGQFSDFLMADIPSNVNAAAPEPVAPSDDAGTQRARSVRKASQQASEGLAAWILQEKAENGDKTSEEDSAVSNYDEADGEWI